MTSRYVKIAVWKLNKIEISNNVNFPDIQDCIIDKVRGNKIIY
jgi:hypothetical protein